MNTNTNQCVALTKKGTACKNNGTNLVNGQWYCGQHENMLMEHNLAGADESVINPQWVANEMTSETKLAAQRATEAAAFAAAATPAVVVTTEAKAPFVSPVAPYLGEGGRVCGVCTTGYGKAHVQVKHETQDEIKECSAAWNVWRGPKAPKAHKPAYSATKAPAREESNEEDIETTGTRDEVKALAMRFGGTVKITNSQWVYTPRNDQS